EILLSLKKQFFHPLRNMAKVIALNRAGKVRNQTAKVPKKRKERSLTGRAKRREMFNRRNEGGLFKNGMMKFNPQF
ncbi:hypothetical protein M153_25317000558, partial [Pseudoloma neurophilia]